MSDQRYTTTFDANEPKRDANRDDYRRDRVPEYAGTGAPKQTRTRTSTTKKTEK